MNSEEKIKSECMANYDRGYHNCHISSSASISSSSSSVFIFEVEEEVMAALTTASSEPITFMTCLWKPTSAFTFATGGWKENNKGLKGVIDRKRRGCLCVCVCVSKVRARKRRQSKTKRR